MYLFNQIGQFYCTLNTLHEYFCYSWLNYHLKLNPQKSCLFFNYCFKATYIVILITRFFSPVCYTFKVFQVFCLWHLPHSNLHYSCLYIYCFISLLVRIEMWERKQCIIFPQGTYNNRPPNKYVLYLFILHSEPSDLWSLDTPPLFFFPPLLIIDLTTLKSFIIFFKKFSWNTQ